MAENNNEKKTYSYSEQIIWDQLWGKSDVQLNIILRESMLKATDIYKGSLERKNETKKCQIISDILAEKKRRDFRSTINQAVYSNTLETAYSNLLAAHTPNGQLIVSILEDEDGQSAEQISSWYEELSQLDKEEYLKLLRDLEKDGVICHSEGKYFLLRKCVENLCFEDSYRFLEWINRILLINKPERSSTLNRYIADYKRIFEFIPVDSPFYKEDIFLEIDKEKIFYDSYKNTLPFTNNDFYKEIGNNDLIGLYRKSRMIIDCLADMGFLKQHDDFYYVPLLGEDKN